MIDKQIIIDGVDVSDCEFYFYREGDEYPHRCSCYKDMYGCSVVCNLADCCENCVYKQLKRKEQENEELKKQLQAQRDFTTHEQKLIYCVAYDRTCKTGNDCKQGKCIFKDNIKLKQTLAEIKEIAEWHTTNTDSQDIQDDMKQILQKISEVEND